MNIKIFPASQQTGAFCNLIWVELGSACLKTEIMFSFACFLSTARPRLQPKWNPLSNFWRQTPQIRVIKVNLLAVLSFCPTAGGDKSVGVVLRSCINLSPKQDPRTPCSIQTIIIFVFYRKQLAWRTRAPYFKVFTSSRDLSVSV